MLFILLKSIKRLVVFVVSWILLQQGPFVQCLFFLSTTILCLYSISAISFFVCKNCWWKEEISYDSRGDGIFIYMQVFLTLAINYWPCRWKLINLFNVFNNSYKSIQLVNVVQSKYLLSLGISSNSFRLDINLKWTPQNHF